MGGAEHYQRSPYTSGAMGWCLAAGDAMVPLADIFNHKASVVLLGDAWGVAELADAPAHDNHHDDSSADPDESSHGQDESSGAEGHSEGGAGEMASEDGSEHAEENECENEGEDGSEDAQHGFAVGGMPIINAAAAAAAGASTAGEEDKSEGERLPGLGVEAAA